MDKIHKINLATLILQTSVLLIAGFVKIRYFSIIFLLLIPQIIMVTINVIAQAFQQCNSKFQILINLDPVKLAPFTQLLNFLLHLEFVFTIIQPVYFMIVEFYEFRYSKEFHFKFDDSNKEPGTHLFLSILILLSLFLPSIFNFISLKMVIKQMDQDDQLKSLQAKYQKQIGTEDSEGSIATFDKQPNIIN
ncbi:UNKNOWN [Stylonychia lemnae]|uniref:Transmembrane protein n=1 Tax=Stylonychia lemnae TaxID=5949 RepID=A0A078AD07_STYLE|nr:UNKNOWN [Stylonychia lemnae]|eukprot:CDW80130.1 UNKNOWN [Stylonychia lemnae]